jgi:hypothetical protein
MLKVFVRSLCCIATATLLCSPALAVPLPIFGPKQYLRSTGAPQDFTDIFQNCETLAQYKLVVVNGAASGGSRVSAASIVLNGVEIFGPRNFNQQIGRIEAPIRAQQVNTLQVRIASAPGSFLTISVECTANCLDIQITSPSSGSLSVSKTLVMGTITSSADEVGVTVNGIVGQTQGSLFSVGGVPLMVGGNDLIATATNACMNQAQTTTHIDVPQIAPALQLTSSPPTGLAPQAVTLRADVSTLQNPVATFQWDFEGKGTVDAAGPGLAIVSHTYAQPGLFFPQLVVIDTQGNQYSATGVVSIISGPQMQALLQTRWTLFKLALMSQQVDQILSFLHPGAARMYGPGLSAAQANLLAFSQSLGNVNLSAFFGSMAELTVSEQQTGNAFLYLIYYAQDQFGLWKIAQM